MHPQPTRVLITNFYMEHQYILPGVDKETHHILSLRRQRWNNLNYLVHHETHTYTYNIKKNSLYTSIITDFQILLLNVFCKKFSFFATPSLWISDSSKPTRRFFLQHNGQREPIIASKRAWMLDVTDSELER